MHAKLSLEYMSQSKLNLSVGHYYGCENIFWVICENQDTSHIFTM